MDFFSNVMDCRTIVNNWSWIWCRQLIILTPSYKVQVLPLWNALAVSLYIFCLYYMCIWNLYTITRIHHYVIRSDPSGMYNALFVMCTLHYVMWKYRNFLSILYSIMRTRHFIMWTDWYVQCPVRYVHTSLCYVEIS